MRTIYSNYARLVSILMLVLPATFLAVLAGCGASGSSTTSAGASVVLTAVPLSVRSDGTSSTTITATVLNSANTVMAGEPVSFSASTGQLGVASGVTDTNGTATVTFSAGPSGINRTATISATSGSSSSQIPVLIVGSTVTTDKATANLTDSATSTTPVTFTALNSSGIAVPGAAINIVKSGAGNVTFSPASGTTNSNGQFVVTVAGVAGGAGEAVLTASALGASTSTVITVSTVTATFSITGLSLNSVAQTSAATNSYSATSMKVGDNLAVTVSVPATSTTSNVSFFSTMGGTWASSGTNPGTVAVVPGGTATDTLTAPSAGVDSVEVFDSADGTIKDTLRVAMTATTPYTVTIQASPSVVQKGSAGTSTLIATVKDVNGAPVGGAYVGFSITNPTGGGETISTGVVVTSTAQTDSLGLGQASTQFVAGSASSNQSGVKIRAQVLGTTIHTGLSPSGNDASIVIGGSPSSVAFGQATELGVNENASQYILAMSVIVSDANGNPAPQGTVVSLSLWPIAWSTGVGCAADPDGLVWDDATSVYVAGDGGTFINEDVNENLTLDATEDGARTYYYHPLTAVAGTSTTDGVITPANSEAGTIPATVTTDANGTATFNLTYPKTSAIWIVDRIQGRTFVQGSEAVGEMQFRLGALRTDVEPCKLPNSHLRF
ncbi:MAG: Ig-like domain-containing protein [Sideroxyarcus sp.]|nr:Ig-like domain-containing protein [Sideroxyarcus sp.]